MPTVSHFVHKLKNIFQRARAEQELEREVRSHLQLLSRQQTDFLRYWLFILRQVASPKPLAIIDAKAMVDRAKIFPT